MSILWYNCSNISIIFIWGGGGGVRFNYLMVVSVVRIHQLVDMADNVTVFNLYFKTTVMRE